MIQYSHHRRVLRRHTSYGFQRLLKIRAKAIQSPISLWSSGPDSLYRMGGGQDERHSQTSRVIRLLLVSLRMDRFAYGMCPIGLVNQRDFFSLIINKEWVWRSVRSIRTISTSSSSTLSPIATDWLPSTFLKRLRRIIEVSYSSISLIKMLSICWSVSPRTLIWILYRGCRMILVLLERSVSRILLVGLIGVSWGRL